VEREQSQTRGRIWVVGVGELTCPIYWLLIFVASAWSQDVIQYRQIVPYPTVYLFLRHWWNERDYILFERIRIGSEKHEKASDIGKDSCIPMLIAQSIHDLSICISFISYIDLSICISFVSYINPSIDSLVLILLDLHDCDSRIVPTQTSPLD
jgi:hypothetical protein